MFAEDQRSHEVGFFIPGRKYILIYYPGWVPPEIRRSIIRTSTSVICLGSRFSLFLLGDRRLLIESCSYRLIMGVQYRAPLWVLRKKKHFCIWEFRGHSLRKTKPSLRGEAQGQGRSFIKISFLSAQPLALNINCLSYAYNIRYISNYYFYYRIYTLNDENTR